MSTVNPHPALKVAVPFAPMIDGWMGDDWFHNGAFRQGAALEFTYDQQAARKGDYKWWSGEYDTYDTFLRAGSAGALAKARGLDQLGFWRALAEHTSYDWWWQQQAVDKLLAKEPITVPMMIVGGLFDQEDIYGEPGAVQGARAEGSARRAAAPRARAVESRPGPARRPRPRRDPVRRRHGGLVPPHGDAAVPRSLSEGRAEARRRRACWPTRPAPTNGASTIPGRRSARRLREEIALAVPAVRRPARRSTRPRPAASVTTNTSPIPRSRCRIASARRCRPAPRIPAGASGWSTISATRPRAPTCSCTRPSR